MNNPLEILRNELKDLKDPESEYWDVELNVDCINGIQINIEYEDDTFKIEMIVSKEDVFKYGHLDLHYVDSDDDDDDNGYYTINKTLYIKDEEDVIKLLKKNYDIIRISIFYNYYDDQLGFENFETKTLYKCYPNELSVIINYLQNMKNKNLLQIQLISNTDEIPEHSFPPMTYIEIIKNKDNSFTMEDDKYYRTGNIRALINYLTNYEERNNLIITSIDYYDNYDTQDYPIVIWPIDIREADTKVVTSGKCFDYKQEKQIPQKTNKKKKKKR
jgi:hypothetical protein